MDEQNELDAVSEQIEQEQSAGSGESDQESKDEYVVPEKYRDKPLKTVFEDLEHANKSMGRYANELGELRKLTDELIKSQLKPQEQPPVKEVDFFENPQEAIRRQIEANPEVQTAKQYAVQARQAMAKSEFERRHPDMMQIVQDKDFQDWVGKSRIRIDLFQRADKFDVDAGDELLSTYKELRAAKAPKQELSEPEKAARDKTLKAASVDSGGTGESSKKIFRRADILKLMMNPAKYRERQREIEAAYAEGRVR